MYSPLAPRIWAQGNAATTLPAPALPTTYLPVVYLGILHHLLSTILNSATLRALHLCRRSHATEHTLSLLFIPSFPVVPLPLSRSYPPNIFSSTSTRTLILPPKLESQVPALGCDTQSYRKLIAPTSHRSPTYPRVTTLQGSISTAGLCLRLLRSSDSPFSSLHRRDLTTWAGRCRALLLCVI